MGSVIMLDGKFFKPVQIACATIWWFYDVRTFLSFYLRPGSCPEFFSFTLPSDHLRNPATAVCYDCQLSSVIHVDQTKAFRESVLPFEIFHQRPDEVSMQVDSVADGSQRLPWNFRGRWFVACRALRRVQPYRWRMHRSWLCTCADCRIRSSGAWAGTAVIGS